jgi:hypothetical protein
MIQSYYTYPFKKSLPSRRNIFLEKKISYNFYDSSRLFFFNFCSNIETEYCDTETKYYDVEIEYCHIETKYYHTLIEHYDAETEYCHIETEHCDAETEH